MSGCGKIAVASVGQLKFKLTICLLLGSCGLTAPLGTFYEYLSKRLKIFFKGLVCYTR